MFRFLGTVRPTFVLGLTMPTGTATLGLRTMTDVLSLCRVVGTSSELSSSNSLTIKRGGGGPRSEVAQHFQQPSQLVNRCVMLYIISSPKVNFNKKNQRTDRYKRILKKRSSQKSQLWGSTRYPFYLSPNYRPICKNIRNKKSLFLPVPCYVFFFFFFNQGNTVYYND
jgi:hypothetical protein